MSVEKSTTETYGAAHSQSPNSALELIEYGDFSNPRCHALHQVLMSCLPAFGSLIRYTFRHFPNMANPQAMFMSLTAEAARRQGRYWPMHQALFTHGSTGSLHTVSALAVMLGLQVDKFLDDLHDETLKDCVRADVEAGNLADVTITPTVFVGTNRIHGKLTYARLVPLLRHYLRRTSTQVLSAVDSTNGSVIWSNTGCHF